MSSIDKEFLEGLASFYYLIICADDVIDEREIRWGNAMLKAENIDQDCFRQKLEQFASQGRDNIYQTCLNSLKKCREELQIKSVAWMSLIANSDGFMAPKEWKLLFQIFSTELGLELKNILRVQQDLLFENQSHLV
jgi:hypothetical protein